MTKVANSTASNRDDFKPGYSSDKAVASTMCPVLSVPADSSYSVFSIITVDTTTTGVTPPYDSCPYIIIFCTAAGSATLLSSELQIVVTFMHSL